MFRLVSEIQDEETGDPDLANQLRRSLSEWLTVPLPFASMEASSLSELGPFETLERRWGADVATCVEQAQNALLAMHGMASPLRAAIADAIVDAEIYEMDWRIYCNRAAVPHFLSLSEEVGCESSRVRFVHSLSDYRKSRPFDLLIQVGPLRSRGWSAVPAALINSPRYRQLRQFVWVGSSDEAGFGEDPLLAAWADSNSGAPMAESVNSEFGPASLSISWVSTTSGAETVPAGTPESPLSIVDELHSFAESRGTSSSCRAVMLHLQDGSGILYRAHSPVHLLVGGDVVRQPVLAEDDPTDWFLLLPDLDPVNLGTHASKDGNFSLRWKEELRRRMQFDRRELLHDLRAGGIKLRDLEVRLDNWMQPPTKVIHAPKQRRHFKILIDILEMEAREATPLMSPGWWCQGAWNEIARSRGIAIQSGIQKQEIIDEELNGVVARMLSEICLRTAQREAFTIDIPSDQSLSGSISFLPIVAIEDGFCAPDSCLKTRSPISALEEWRA